VRRRQERRERLTAGEQGADVASKARGQGREGLQSEEKISHRDKRLERQERTRQRRISDFKSGGEEGNSKGLTLERVGGGFREGDKRGWLRKGGEKSMDSIGSSDPGGEGGSELKPGFLSRRRKKSGNVVGVRRRHEIKLCSLLGNETNSSAGREGGTRGGAKEKNRNTT